MERVIIVPMAAASRAVELRVTGGSTSSGGSLSEQARTQEGATEEFAVVLEGRHSRAAVCGLCAGEEMRSREAASGGGTTDIERGGGAGW